MGSIIPTHFYHDRNPFMQKGLNPKFIYYGNNRNMHLYPPTHGWERNDIGFSQLIKTDKKMMDNGMDFILQNSPRIRIQQCIQETKLETIIDAISNLSDGFKSGREAYDKAKDSGKLGAVAKWFCKALQTNVIWEVFKNVQNLPIKSPVNGEDDFQGLNILKAVYALQYCLMQKNIVATYNFPYNATQLYSADGTIGWENGGASFAGTSSNSILGKALNFLGSQIRIVTEPIWQGTNQTNQSTIQLKVNLFNNTMEQAIDNYILVNTLIPNAKYLQYGIIQQAPAYYDVHIFGINRFPLCLGTFNCNAKGLIRKVDLKNLKLTVKGDRLNKINNTAGSKIKKHELRIPDVYELDMTFKSRLPDSFNEFLYFWYLDEFSKDNMVPKHIFDDDAVADLKSSAEKLMNHALEYADKGEAAIANDIEDEVGDTLGLPRPKPDPEQIDFSQPGDRMRYQAGTSMPY